MTTRAARRDVLGGQVRPWIPPACLVAWALIWSISSLAVFAADGLPLQPPDRKDPVRLHDEILPLLAANCAACHNAKLREGGLSLDSLQSILTGGDSGPSVIAGTPAKSRLLLRAAHREEDFMPPADNKVGAKNLGPVQLGLLERWIAEGATSGPAPFAKPIDWKPIPAGAGGVVAVTLTRDGRITAAARGGRVSLFDTASGRLLGTLVDPSITSASGPAGVAHRDLVTAVECASSGDLLASGSFRTIKFWRRRTAARTAELAGSTDATALTTAVAGTTAAVGLADGRIILCDTTNGSTIRIIPAHAAAVSGVAFAADGATLYSCGHDGLVLATRVADGTAIGRLARTGEVRAIALVNGGSRVATAEADAVIRVWPLPLPAPEDAAPAKPLKELTGMPQPTTVMADVPAMSGHLLSGGSDGVIRLWNVDAGNVVRQFSHGGPVAALAVRPDGTRMATVGTVPGVKLWDTANGQLRAEWKGDLRRDDARRAADIECAVAEQDVQHGKTAVTAAEKAVQAAAEETKKSAEKLPLTEKTLAEKTEVATQAAAARTVAATAAGQAVAAVPLATEAHAAATKAAAAAAGSAEAATASVASFTKATAGDPTAAETLKSVQAAATSATAAKAAADQAVTQTMQQIERSKAKVIETEKKAAEAVKLQDTTEEARKQAATGVTAAKRAVEFAHQQTTQTTAQLPERKADLIRIEERLAVVDVSRKQIVTDLTASQQQPLRAVTFSPDGAWFACLGQDGRVTVFGANDGQPRRAWDCGIGADRVPTLMAWSNDARLVVGGGPATGAVWDASDVWTLERTIGGEQTPPAADDDPVGPPVDAVLSLAFSPDSSLLASGSGRVSRSGEIKLWKVADGSLTRALPSPHSDTVMALDFSHRGDLLASGATDRFVKVHRVADGARVQSFEGHTGHVLGVSWQANGRRLASAGADSSIKVWDTLTGEQQRTITVGKKEVTAVAFVPPGEELAAASGDSTVRLYNAASGGTVRQYEAVGDFVQSLKAASPYLAAGTQDGRLRIWNTATGAVLHTLEPSPAAGQ